jgi:GNAT superfamily N-acetyltransferase
MKGKFKSEILEANAKHNEPAKKFRAPTNMEEVEIKKLRESDVEESAKVMRKCLFSVTDAEIGQVIARGMSYGAFVDRILVSVGLSWEVRFNPETLDFEEGEGNAIFLEDDAILLAYEGRGIRELLIEKREEEGRGRGKEYAVAITSSINPNDEKLGDAMMQRGNKTEKALIRRGYDFSKTPNGVVAYKKL